MRIETGREMAEQIKHPRHGRVRQLFLGLESCFQRQLWPARLAVMVALVAVALLVGVLLFNYSSKLYENWRQTHLLHRATALLQEGKLSKATQTAQELLRRRPDSLPALYVLAEAAERQNLEEAVSWRGQIARLLPKDVESQLNLASAALRFGKLDLARCGRCLMTRWQGMTSPQRIILPNNSKYRRKSRSAITSSV